MSPPAGQSPEEDDEVFPAGMRFGRYEIVRALGAGGMGAVYEATHIDIGKGVAVKVLNPSVAAIPGARARFLREAQLTSRVRHPNIVDVTDMGTEGRHTYLVMELLRGEDLAHRLARTGPISVTELADIMLPLCSAVAAAHAAGVTHRDLKPQNIFLAAGRHNINPKILDFGISKGDDAMGASALTGTGAMIGTPFYLAPEQIMDSRSAGPASDQYALGVILYECLTGARPYEGENLFAVFQTIVAGSALRPRERRPDLPPAIEEIVMRAMHLSAGARFASTEDLGRSLLPYASDRTRTIWAEAYGEPALPDAYRPASGSTPAPPYTPAASPAPPYIPATPAPPRVPTTPMPPSARMGGGMGIPTPISATPPPATGPTPPISFGSRPTPMPVARTPAPATPPPPAAAQPPVVGAPSGTRVLDAYKSPVPAPPRRPTRPSRPRGIPPVEEVDRTGGLNSSRAPIKIIAGVVVVVLGTIAALVVLNSPESHDTRETRPRKTQPPVALEHADDPATQQPARKVVPSFMATVVVEPETATIELDGQAVGRGNFHRSFPADGTPHTLRVSAEGFEPRTIEFTDDPPPPRLSLAPIPVKLTPPPEPERATARANDDDRGGGKRNSGGKSSGGKKIRSPRAGASTSAGGGARAGEKDDAQRVNPNGAPVLD